ncbi:MAG: DUF5906 domain-containing protein [Candidatus Devosia phytovorans]|uniref:DUF5906 domain-containing protein n=1 Tax=Candidatus Devosia phytovorans TaxID=3121372 RepID=A0AAJ5VTL8_9HYPH|nr:DUF5906 domain-containing protein [Devosia sp.]WEK03258.1 MAG: DUF5906 domain-containing protein [Devosia sp.]
MENKTEIKTERTLKDSQLYVDRYCAIGFALHWLHTKSKRPIGNDWSEKPVLSAERLKATYREGNNLGVRTGEWSVINGAFLHIVDVDIRRDELKGEAFAKLAEVFPELDVATAPQVISGSGGESRHFYVLSDKAFSSHKFAHSEGFQMVWDDVRQRDVKKWDWELHLLGTGSQAVIPPSIHPDTGLPYRWEREFDFEKTTVFPAAVLQRVTGYEEPVEVDPARLKPMGLDIETVHDVLADLPLEDWFEDRAGWVNVGMAIHHELGGGLEAFNLWCEYSRRSSKFNLEDSERVWRSFKNKSNRPFRMASLVAVARDERLQRNLDDLDDEFDDLGPIGGKVEDQFEDLLGNGPAKPTKESRSQAKLKKEQLETALGKEAPGWVRRLNKKHAVARVSGKTVIMDFTYDDRVAYGTATDLHTFYENDRRPRDEGVMVPVSKVWLQHAQRRTYPNGIVFLPNQDVDGAYNHWQGFSVEPDGTKSCKLFLKHLKEVFCSNNEGHYRYMLGWLAHMIQKPEDKPGVAVVAKGKKRIGKDTVFEYVGELFRQHYITIANKDQLVGKFNQHQEKCLLLHVQEGFWAGDKRDEGPLKYLITSREVMIEPKGVNAFSVKSVLRLFISSNERWVVPATEDEGRFFVLNVSDQHRNDHPYFEALRAEMANGGPAALLDYLMNYDISNFQVRAVPDTEALAEQKLEGLKNVERWWFETLQSGSIDGVGNRWESGVTRIPKQDFRDSYAGWMRGRRYEGDNLGEVEFTKRLKVLLPALQTMRSRALGEHRPYLFVIPDLRACRASFDETFGLKVGWGEDLDKIEDEAEDDLAVA